MTVSVVVSYPGIFMHAQQAARAFHERGALASFVTGVVIDQDGTLARLARRLPCRLGERVRRECGRRFITEVPRERVVSYPWLETARAALARYGRNPIYADIVWDAMSHRFDAAVARRHFDGASAVHAFEYTAEYSFLEARRRGLARILALPSLDNRETREIRERETARFPELRTRHDRHFERHFARRQARRSSEIELADLIIANSEVTRRSHIHAGTNPDKIVALPLAAPPPMARVTKPPDAVRGPLTVVWAGNFSLGKGAHYFLDAWRGVAATGAAATARVFGRIAIPERLLRPLSPGLQLMGAVTQPELLAAFEAADVLVFPTLADGFGAVVTEAFSRGLPVITTERAGACELVERGRNGLIVPAADASALRDALCWCLDNRRALYEMRFAALATARRWQWPDYRRRLIDLVATKLRGAGYEVTFDYRPAVTECSRCASAS
ncbi:MAG TPA: glycosyltransferase family 4 protein [Stellaceae bacterium]|nr:glycosyltransferase family 4 protein [Stellaceae bacterium]